VTNRAPDLSGGNNRKGLNDPTELVLSGRVRLLEIDPELGTLLQGAELAQARENAVLPAMHLTEGRWDFAQLRGERGVRGGVYGFMLASGAVTIT
jgi:hypothetical protein